MCQQHVVLSCALTLVLRRALLVFMKQYIGRRLSSIFSNAVQLMNSKIHICPHSFCRRKFNHPDNCNRHYLICRPTQTAPRQPTEIKAQAGNKEYLVSLTNERYACPLCSAKIGRQDSLQRHLDSHCPCSFLLFLRLIVLVRRTVIHSEAPIASPVQNIVDRMFVSFKYSDLKALNL